MKVLHVVKRVDLAGGAERLISEIASRNEDHFVLYYFGGESFYKLPPERVFKAKGMLHAIMTCFLRRKDFALFHLHLFPSIYFSALLGSRSIIHEHNSYNRRREIRSLRWLESIIYRRPALVVAISDAVKHSLSEWIRSEKGIAVLYNFVTPIPVKYEKALITENTAPRRVLMVASFTSQKRQDLVIRAVPFLPQDIKIYFAGDGPKLHEMRTLVQSMGLTEQVVFLGNVKEIHEEYRKAGLCILLSNWEGFGLTIIEAAQHGLITLVSDVPGARDIVPDKSWIIEDDAPQAVAQKISRALEGKGSDINSDTIREYAGKFDVNEYLRNLDLLYKNAVEDN